MFSVEERDRVRARLLARAEADEAVVGAAWTGSHAVAAGDRWSDTDLVLAVRGGLAATVDRWTRWLRSALGARHHWDLRSDTSTVRVFLLPGWLEVDLTFTPEAEFGPRGPQWHTVFGRTRTPEPFPEPDGNALAGLLWHHVLHAFVCLERGHRWQAAYWIGAVRDHVVTLACLRLGLPAAHAKGAHLLPDELAAELETTLVRSLDGPDLRRALTAAVTVAAGELRRSDPALAARLSPLLAELEEANERAAGGR
ncbi:hypothetical protein DVA86_05350 [Streptomyces armeniacus]|uniref:Nucleotidyltransferase domain-containing protein n=1 Tax=Streptomyces armeniacus TaxID=83291 RepID=A0A345XKJ8_9ACTN|nr:hypothetical protein [Streptomyces armeniacus]AXK32164.1 hypothetical protein DVA86_05350 [Streptomyces armeniacus]